MERQRVALITGVSSGIGRATAEALVAAGFRVFGSVRKLGTNVPAGVEALELDVRDAASVDAALGEVETRAGRLDALVNNAGVTLVGAIEETDTEQAKALFETNFFGAVRVTRAALPMLRAQRSGRIVFVGSVTGFVPAPFMGFYSASKHALEGYAESLDHEVRTLGIRVTLVEPGFMQTRIDQNSSQAARKIDDYAQARERVGAGIREHVQSGDDPELVARAILDALNAREPRLRYPVGKGAGSLALLRSWLPSALFDRSFRKEFRLDAR